MKKTIVVLFTLFAQIVFACDCPPLNSISVKESETYDVIFFGTIDSVDACDEETALVYFTIQELYKGVAEQYVSVRFDCSSSCSMSFEKNEKWIVYAKYVKFNELVVVFCSHTRKYIADKEKDYYTTTSLKTFDEEQKYLQSELGIQIIVKRNVLNEQQKEMKHQNQLPSGTNTLLLLAVSLLAMLVIYFITKKYFKNGK